MAEGHVHLVSWNHFCSHINMCVSVCFPLRVLITSGVIWCHTGWVWLVKPILQLFSLLLSINWKSVVLVTQLIVHAKQRCPSWCRTSHRRRRINYLAVATRWSASIIKVSGRMHSDKFKRRLGFSFTVIIKAKNNFQPLLKSLIKKHWSIKPI